MKISSIILNWHNALGRGAIFLLTFMASMSISAQNLKVHGVVTDADTGEEIVGATVQTSDKSTGTVTDVMGTYQLTVKSGKSFVVSYVGYESQTM